MRQWAIVIGLNDYQFFQPLSCAQQDAQALHQFLIEEAKFSAEQCLLFTNTSPHLWGKPTSPTRANLLDWIELLAQNCFKPGDLLWFFFSGYGVCSQGKDYLVPVDGDPFAVETTCIPIGAILSRLQSLAMGLPLVLLDICRSQGTYSNESVGMQTAQLAKQFAIPTILSCQPGQFSREVSSLGYGLFTVALLEGLRYQQGATPATLMQFLSDRLPELSEHYWQPAQHPLNVCPSEKLHQPLLASQAANGVELGSSTASQNGHGVQPIVGEVVPTAGSVQTATSVTADRAAPVANGAHANLRQRELVQIPDGKTDAAAIALDARDIPAAQSSAGGTGSTGREPIVEPPPPTTHADVKPDAGSDGLWRPILLWGSLLSLGLIGCVLWRNWSYLWASPQAAISNAASVSSTAATVQSAPTAIASPDTIRSTSATAGAASNDRPAPSPAPVSPSPNQALNFNPAPPPAKTTGQVILENARKQVLSDQATPYRDAIDEAKKIQSDDPVYADAQQDIANWSQSIWTIAQRRAGQKQWDIAIMAADLVPLDNPKLRPQAQTAIGQWCPTVKDRPVKDFATRQAKAICAQQPI